MLPISIPWYESEDDFKTVLSALPISESHDAISYAGWVARIQELEQGAVSRGQLPIRVTIKPSSIKEWCNASNLPFSRSSIATYAATKMGSDLIARGGN